MVTLQSVQLRTGLTHLSPECQSAQMTSKKLSKWRVKPLQRWTLQ